MLGLLQGTAFAHATLQSATPAPDGAAATVKEIKLSFSEGVNPKFSGIELKDQAGKTVPTGSAAIDPKDDKELIVPVDSELGAGTYTVEWHAVSADTHRVNGTFTFQVVR